MSDGKVVEWENTGPEDIIWRYPHSELKFGTALIVREYEGAAFLRDGKLLDVFEPGRHILSTQNLPVLTRLYKLGAGYKESPFKADVIFFSKKMFNGNWGLRTLVKAAPTMDAPITLMANGIYQFRVEDPVLFLTQVVGGMSQYTAAATSDFLRGFFNEKLMQELSKYTYVDVYGNLEETSRKAMVNILDPFSQRGIQLLALKIANVDTEERYKKDLYQFMRFRSDAGREYRQYEVMEDMAVAIGASSGGAAIGTGMLLFPQMYQQLSQAQGGQKVGCPFCGCQNTVPYSFCSNCGKGPMSSNKQPATTTEQKSETSTPSEGFSICPYCGKDLNLPKTPRFCPYCKEKLQ
jgi:membrane protease subunit (stomatin/prohibitin family)